MTKWLWMTTPTAALKHILRRFQRSLVQRDPAVGQGDTKTNTDSTEPEDIIIEQENSIAPIPRKPRAKRSSSGSRRSSSRKKTQRIGKNVRVKTTRAQLFHALRNDAQRANLPTTFGNSHNFYGSVVGGNTKDGYDVKFDLLPSSEELDNDGVMKPNNVMHGFSRQKLAIHDIDEAEVAYDREPPSEAEEDSATKRTPYGRSVDEFCELPAYDLKDARSFSMKFGAAPSDTITWVIFPLYVRKYRTFGTQL